MKVSLPGSGISPSSITTIVYLVVVIVSPQIKNQNLYPPDLVVAVTVTVPFERPVTTPSDDTVAILV